MLSPDIFMLRLGLSMVLGMAVGFEREYNQKRAGLRTQTLVTMGAAAYVYISTLVVGASSGDATRIAGQIASGVGFLGAGVIMREGANIRGINTAATIWCSSAVGCLAGLGLYIESGFFAGCVICMNLLFKPLAKMILGNGDDFEDTKVDVRLMLKVNKNKELYIKGLIIQFIIDDEVELLELKSFNELYEDYCDLELTLRVLNKAKSQTVYHKTQNLLTPEIGVRFMEWSIIK